MPSGLVSCAVGPAESGRSGSGGSAFQSSRLQAGGRRGNDDVVNVHTIIASARSGGINHDGEVTILAVGRNQVFEFLIRSGEPGLFHNQREGAGVGRIAHRANLESAAGVVATSLQCHLHAGQARHFRQDGILRLWVVVFVRPIVIFIVGIELQAVGCRIGIVGVAVVVNARESIIFVVCGRVDGTPAVRQYTNRRGCVV